MIRRVEDDGASSFCAMRGAFGTRRPAVLLHRARNSCAAGGGRQIFNVIADCQHDLVRHEAFFHQLQRELIRHFPQNEPRLCRLIRGSSAPDRSSGCSRTGGRP